jgi:hypothetical protein
MTMVFIIDLEIRIKGWNTVPAQAEYSDWKHEINTVNYYN